MFKLKYTQKLGLLISITTTLVILLSFLIFITLFYKTSTNQIRKSLLLEATEVIENYIKYDNEKLIIINREDLARDVLRDQLSIMIIAPDATPIDSFGLFAKDDSTDLFNDSDKFINSIKDSINSRKPIFNSLISKGNGNSHILLISPLVSTDKTIGAIAIISPMENINIILRNSIFLILTILPITVILLYFVGQTLGAKALKPVRELDSQIKNINFSNLKSNFTPKGHIEDDTYKLTLEFNQMMDRVKEGIEKQKSFISNSSHELRTPLTRLQTSLDLIKGNKNIKKEISEEIKAMSNTLSRLSILAKIGKKENRIEKVHLYTFIISEYNNDRILNKVSKKVYLNIDKADLKIICDNLISNALKYSSKSVKIATKDNSMIISDKGFGIPKKDISRITSPFYRSRNILKQGIEGTGLGLSIVKEICDEYSFKMNIKSKVSKGTEVEIVFA